MTNSHTPATSPRPFTTAPDPSRYFPASAIEEARQRVARSISRGEGPVLVIGEAGLGKTMLLEVVAHQFREQLRSILLVGGQLCTRRALLQMMLFQLDLPYRGMDESELRLALLGYLQPHDGEPRRVLLLVDEADALPTRLLEELRVLTNLSAAGQVLINLVLAGNSTLEEQFADPKLDLFSQRVSARCYLSAFGREQTFQYVLAQVAAFGADPETFITEEGLDAIFAATDGVPRLINQLGDQLLWMIDESGCSPLDGMIVQQAWSELQQLPAPWNTQSGEPVGVPVEYGELDADGSDFDVQNHNGGEFDLLDGGNGNSGNENQHDSLADDVVRSDRSKHLTEFDPTDIEHDDCLEEDDDLPSSIPINASQMGPATSRTEDLNCSSATGSEILDVTEQLLIQINELDSAGIESEETATRSPETAHNPFVETFESEEVVLDRYSTFESHLLADAPRVANRADSAFAQQLQTLEAQETRQPPSGTEATCATVVASQSVTVTIDETLDATPTTQQESAEAVGEVLLIEEGAEPATEIVDGRKFRQLFSNLEAAGGEPCFG